MGKQLRQSLLFERCGESNLSISKYQNVSSLFLYIKMVGDRALYGGAGLLLNNIKVKITIMDLLDNSVETGHFNIIF